MLICLRGSGNWLPEVYYAASCYNYNAREWHEFCDCLIRDLFISAEFESEDDGRHVSYGKTHCNIQNTISKIQINCKLQFVNQNVTVMCSKSNRIWFPSHGIE